MDNGVPIPYCQWSTASNVSGEQFIKRIVRGVSGIWPFLDSPVPKLGRQLHSRGRQPSGGQNVLVQALPPLHGRPV